MNEGLLIERLEFAERALRNNTEAVRIAKIQYSAGSMDLLSVLQLQETQLRTEADVIELRNTQLGNRIDLHLALGGSFDTQPAAASVRTSGGS